MALFKLTLKHQDAIDSHQPFYDGNFEVLPMRRRGFFDIFPLSLLFAYADMAPGEWDGIISTNGKKIVITQSKWRDPAKHKKVYEFDLDEIESIKSSYLGLTLILKNHVKGLTMSKVNYFLKYPLVILTLGGVFHFLLKGKLSEIHLKNDFENEDKFKSLLNI